MSLPAEPSKIPEYVGVMKLANGYLAMHIQGKQKKFISAKFETDIKIAQEAALTFAQVHLISYQEKLLELEKPLITVIKHKDYWFPAQLYPGEIRLLERISFCFFSLHLAGSQQRAIQIAKAIAWSKRGECNPSIGISLLENQVWWQVALD